MSEVTENLPIFGQLQEIDPQLRINTARLQINITGSIIVLQLIGTNIIIHEEHGIASLQASICCRQTIWICHEITKINTITVSFAAI